MLPLRAAINKAKSENKPVRKENVRVDQNGSMRNINLEVIPLKNVRESSFLVLFESAEKSVAKQSTPKTRKKPVIKREGEEEERELFRLERELTETRDKHDLPARDRQTRKSYAPLCRSSIRQTHTLGGMGRVSFRFEISVHLICSTREVCIPSNLCEAPRVVAERIALAKA